MPERTPLPSTKENIPTVKITTSTLTHFRFLEMARTSSQPTTLKSTSGILIGHSIYSTLSTLSPLKWTSSTRSSQARSSTQSALTSSCIQPQRALLIFATSANTHTLASRLFRWRHSTLPPRRTSSVK